MSWEEFTGILVFVFQAFFLALVVLGCIIVVVAIMVGALRGFRQLRKPKP